MKKWISLLCVAALVIGMLTVCAVSASAEDFDKGSTAVDVKSGDKVTYILKLSDVEEPIIGSDFSVYYDPSVFELESVADYNDNTDSDEWEAVINPDLEGEVRGVWSILKGVDFSSQRNFLTLNLKAVADADNTHITYRIRFLYDNNVFNSNDHPQITKYVFTCDLIHDGTKEIEDAAPELDTEKEPENGKFVPSLDGNSDHADPELPGVIDKAKNNTGNGQSQQVENKANAENQVKGGNANTGSAGSGNNAANNNSGANNSANNANSKTNVTTAPPATTADGYFVTATDAQGNITATSDEAPVVATTTGNSDKKGGSPVLWIIIVLVVLAGGGAAVYFFMKKPKNAPGGDTAAQAAAPAADAAAPVNEATAPLDDASAPVTEPEAGAEETTELVDESNTEVIDEGTTEVIEEDQTTQLADDPTDPGENE